MGDEAETEVEMSMRGESEMGCGVERVLEVSEGIGVGKGGGRNEYHE